MLFPTTCVDNFFDNPKAVRELAYSLERSPSPEGNWPGSRTDALHIVAPEYYNFFSKKLFSLFYNFNLQTTSWEISTYFQFIEPYSQNKSVNVGWVHKDDDTTLSGLIYLNENAPLNCGTSLFIPKNIGAIPINGEAKHNFFKLKDSISEEEYVKKLEENNALFTETVTVNNIYNRMICYDGANYHRANSFMCDSSEPRLTQVFFAHKVISDWFPVPSMRAVQ